MLHPAAEPQADAEVNQVSRIGGAPAAPTPAAVKRLEHQLHFDGLTSRECQCLGLLCKGHRTKRIAHRIGISTATVEFHLANARRKLGARTREQAVARAVHMGVVTP